MTAPLLVDELGPRARRRVLIVTVASTVVLLGVTAVVISRLSDRGQLRSELWKPFTLMSTARFLWGGVVNTLKMALVAMALALAIGAVMALGRLARSAPVRWLAGAYVEVFRALPLLLLILFCGLALPKYGLDWPVFSYAVLALTLYNSAVLGEIFRAGILSLDRGQSEAAFAVGLTYWQAMFFVVIPQAARRMIPSILSQLVTLLKDTALVFVLGLVLQDQELLRRTRQFGEFYRNPLQSYVVAALIYFVINFALSRIARRLEVRQRRRYKADAIVVGGAEDLAVTAGAAMARGPS
jgi:glutamate transport system permease protein